MLLKLIHLFIQTHLSRNHEFHVHRQSLNRQTPLLIGILDLEAFSFLPCIRILIHRKFQKVLLLLFDLGIQSQFSVTTGFISPTKVAIENFLLPRSFSIKNFFSVLYARILIIQNCQNVLLLWTFSIFQPGFPRKY